MSRRLFRVLITPAVTAVLLAIVLPLLGTGAAAQDARAVEHARALIERRTPPAEVARTIAAEYRLREPEVVTVLAAAKMSASATAGAMVEGFRAAPVSVVEWLIAAGYPEEDVMGAATRMRVRPDAVLRAFRAARVTAGRAAAATARAVKEPTTTARLLVAAGWSAAETSPALIGAYRLGGDDAAKAFREADLPAREVAGGLVEVAGGPREALTSLERGGYDFTDIREAALHTLTNSPEEWALYLKDGGATAVEAGTALRDDYGLGAVEAGVILMSPPVWYSIQKTAVALVTVWGLDHETAPGVFEAVFDDAATEMMVHAGVAPPRPTIHGYRIRDPRPGHAGAWLENVGIVDPSAVGPMAPEDHDGRVEVLLPVRDLDQLEFTMGGTPGQILGRTPETFTDGGTTYDGEWVEVEFNGFSSGPLRAERQGRSFSRSAIPLGYRVIEGDVLTGSLESMDIRLGDPVGEGSVVIPDRTWEGVQIEGGTESFDVPVLELSLLDAELVDLRSSDVSTEVTPLGDGSLAVDVVISFESAGAEIDGVARGEPINCWTCGDLQVPVATCGSFTLACAAQHLGLVLGALGACADQNAWTQEPVPGPSVEFEADLDNTVVRLGLTVGTDGSGGFVVQSDPPEFDADLSLRTGVGTVDLALLESWIFADVGARLASSLETMDLAARAGEGLNQLGPLVGDVRGIYLTQTGRWFLETTR